MLTQWHQCISARAPGKNLKCEICIRGMYCAREPAVFKASTLMGLGRFLTHASMLSAPGFIFLIIELTCGDYSSDSPPFVVLNTSGTC